jgi:membrane-bound lytic murein transglycosylase B
MKIIVSLICLCLIHFNLAYADDDKQAFDLWINDLKIEALANGISAETVNTALDSVSLVPSAVTLDRTQPEFITTFINYLSRRVNLNTVSKGRDLMQANAALLDSVEAHYGVPKQVLVAFWSLETNFGKNQGDFSLPSALVTLAYEGRRAEFFRTELLNLLRIMDQQHLPLAKLQGSWAGAMGQMQFMPSTFLKYAVDVDDNGQIDLWDSLPDAMGSAANYLTSIGWKTQQPVALQVSLPANFDYSLAQLNVRKSVAEWGALGVDVPAAWKLLDNTAILLPQGWSGPAFMVFDNFDVVMHWNRSVNYALSVANFANWLGADTPVYIGEGVELDALSYNQVWALQAKLNELGFDCGKPDGLPGQNTQKAIRLYQASHALPQDGYASPSLYHQLLNN